MPQTKILVITGDKGMTDMLAMLLSSISPEIITASTGPSGIDLARKYQPDLILLDLILPERNGWTVCKDIREFSNTPILILTSIDSPEVLVQALDAGADDYLVKPVSGNTLIAHINNLLRRSKFSTQSLKSPDS
jgi:DNA-binding response OmpR family regulator